MVTLGCDADAHCALLLLLLLLLLQHAPPPLRLPTETELNTTWQRWDVGHRNFLPLGVAHKAVLELWPMLNLAPAVESAYRCAHRLISFSE